MLAAQISRFGGSEVLELNEVDRPTPNAGEVVVAIEAASVNGHDTILRSGGMKFVSGRRFPIGLGLDFVGAVTEVGAGSSRFTVGERVWGTVHPQKRHVVGSAAEYVAVTEDRLGAAPSGLPAPDAAALVVAGATALIALQDALAIRSGQRLLIRGAAGGVGSAAVQIAHARGAHVTALAGARSGDSLRALGADLVLDRRTTDPGPVGPFDAVLDLVGSQLPAGVGA